MKFAGELLDILWRSNASLPVDPRCQEQCSTFVGAQVGPPSESRTARSAGGYSTDWRALNGKQE